MPLIQPYVLNSSADCPHYPRTQLSLEDITSINRTSSNRILQRHITYAPILGQFLHNILRDMALLPQDQKLPKIYAQFLISFLGLSARPILNKLDTTKDVIIWLGQNPREVLKLIGFDEASLPPLE